jgi:hypothetical protein
MLSVFVLAAAHNNAYTKVFNACGIVTQKKTHATRVFMATNGRQNGAGESSVKSHGGWSAGSAFGASYAKHIPVDAIVAAAGFSGKDPSTYILTRDQIAVEPEMAEEIFPWIEDEEAALKSRQTRNPDCQDLALESFLQFLRWSRTVLLQDTAILMRTCSDLNILQFAPFNNPRFHRFAQSTYGIMEEFALGRQSLFQNLPAELRTGLVDVGASMKGELCQINARLSDFHEQGGPGELAEGRDDGCAITGGVRSQFCGGTSQVVFFGSVGTEARELATHSDECGGFPGLNIDNNVSYAISILSFPFPRSSFAALHQPIASSRRRSRLPSSYKRALKRLSPPSHRVG